MRDCEQGCADQCGWSGIWADLGIVAIAAITLTIAAMDHQARTYHEGQQFGADTDLPAWQGVYHIKSPAPTPVPTGWSDEARHSLESLQWDCELMGAEKKTPTIRATPQDDRSYLRVYSPGVSRDSIALVVEHQHQRTRKRD